MARSGSDDDMCQVLMLNVHREVYEQWLASVVLELVLSPVAIADLSTYVVTPTEETMRAYMGRVP